MFLQAIRLFWGWVGAISANGQDARCGCASEKGSVDFTFSPPISRSRLGVGRLGEVRASFVTGWRRAPFAAKPFKGRKYSARHNKGSRFSSVLPRFGVCTRGGYAGDVIGDKAIQFIVFPPFWDPPVSLPRSPPDEFTRVVGIRSTFKKTLDTI